MSFSEHMEKKHLAKQVIPITYTPEKEFFADDNFEGLGALSFQREYKKL